MRSAIRKSILIKNARAVRTGNPQQPDVNGQGYTVQALIEGSGAVSASVDIYGSHAPNATLTRCELIGQLSPAGTDVGQDSISFDAPWPYLIADLTAISGTGAVVNVTLGD